MSSGSTPDTMTIMPTVQNNTSTGYSNRAMPSCERFQSSARISARAEPSKDQLFVECGKRVSDELSGLKPNPLTPVRNQQAGDQERTTIVNMVASSVLVLPAQHAEHQGSRHAGTGQHQLRHGQGPVHPVLDPERSEPWMLTAA